MLNEEFKDFYRNWRQKADGYLEDGSLQGAFDRFFTLWVIYNRLYAEATFRLVQRGTIPVPRGSFPDGNAAKVYACQFVGARRLIGHIEANENCLKALQEIRTLLEGPVDGRQFSIKLSMIGGEPQRNIDLELLRHLRSSAANVRAQAVLEFLYAVRCNLFHGHKGFNEVQLQVLSPSSTLLVSINEILFESLSRNRR